MFVSVSLKINLKICEGKVQIIFYSKFLGLLLVGFGSELAKSWTNIRTVQCTVLSEPHLVLSVYLCGEEGGLYLCGEEGGLYLCGEEGGL